MWVGSSRGKLWSRTFLAIFQYSSETFRRSFLITAFPLIICSGHNPFRKCLPQLKLLITNFSLESHCVCTHTHTHTHIHTHSTEAHTHFSRAMMTRLLVLFLFCWSVENLWIYLWFATTTYQHTSLNHHITLTMCSPQNPTFLLVLRFPYRKLIGSWLRHGVSLGVRFLEI